MYVVCYTHVHVYFHVIYLFCTFSSESVSVGVVMRNPLKVPLVMKGVALTWSHSPLQGGGGGGGGGGEKAKAEVVERVVLPPLSEKMVSLFVE